MNMELMFYFLLGMALMSSAFASIFIIIGVKDSVTKANRNILHALVYALLAIAVAIWK